MNRRVTHVCLRVDGEGHGTEALLWFTGRSLAQGSGAHCTGVGFRLCVCLSVSSPKPLAASFCLPACLLLSIGLLVYLSVYQHVNLLVYQSVFLYVSPSPTRLHTAGVSYIISVSFPFPFHYFSVYLSIKATTKCTFLFLIFALDFN